MKIIDNINNTIFSGLNPGDIFKFPDWGNIYMKTTEPDSSNCVNLTNGHLGHISGDDFVIVLNATLILE